MYIYYVIVFKKKKKICIIKISRLRMANSYLIEHEQRVFLKIMSILWKVHSPQDNKLLS